MCIQIFWINPRLFCFFLVLFGISLAYIWFCLIRHATLRWMDAMVYNGHKMYRGHQWRAFPWITATLICIDHHNSYRAISELCYREWTVRYFILQFRGSIPCWCSPKNSPQIKIWLWLFFWNSDFFHLKDVCHFFFLLPTYSHTYFSPFSNNHLAWFTCPWVIPSEWKEVKLLKLSFYINTLLLL